MRGPPFETVSRGFRGGGKQGKCARRARQEGPAHTNSASMWRRLTWVLLAVVRIDLKLGACHSLDACADICAVACGQPGSGWAGAASGRWGEGQGESHGVAQALRHTKPGPLDSALLESLCMLAAGL